MTFWKKKEIPIVKFDGHEFKYDSSNKMWSFDDDGVSIYIDGSALTLPVNQLLVSFRKILNKYQEHIDSRIDEMVWDEMNRSSARLACIEISNTNEFSVSYLGDESWGDLGYDIWFKNGEIINEGAAD